MKKFYFHDGDHQHGPFHLSELQQQNISKDTPVWFEGISDWLPAGDIDELKELFVSQPPPYTQKQTVSAPYDYNYPKKNNYTRRILMVVCFIGVTLIAGYLYATVKQHSYQASRQRLINNEEDLKKLTRENITSYVTAARNTYQYSNLGGIHNLKITVSNSSNYLIDNVRVKINYYKSSGGIWRTRYEDFNMVRANTVVTRDIPDTNRGVRIEYEIESIKSNTLGL